MLGSVFLASMDLEKIITFVFFGIEFDSPFGTPHFQLWKVLLQKSCCKTHVYAEILLCSIISANWDREFRLWCGVGRLLT